MRLKLGEGSDAVVELIDEHEEQQAHDEAQRDADADRARHAGLFGLRGRGILPNRDDILIDVAADLDVSLRGAERFELRALPLDPRPDRAVFGQPLAQVERFGLILVDRALEILHFQLDRLAPLLEIFRALLAKDIDELLLLGDLPVELDHDRMLGPQDLLRIRRAPRGVPRSAAGRARTRVPDHAARPQEDRRRGWFGPGFRCGGCDLPVARHLLIELEEIEELRFLFQIGELRIELGEIGAGAVALLLKKADVVFPLEGEQRILLPRQFRLFLFDFIGNRAFRVLALLRPHFTPRGDVFFHQRVEEFLRIARLHSGRGEIVDRRSGDRRDGEFHGRHGNLRKLRAHPRFRPLAHRVVLHQRLLGLEEIRHLLRVRRGLVKIDFSAHEDAAGGDVHHLLPGALPGARGQPRGGREKDQPPEFPEQRLVAIDLGVKQVLPRARIARRERCGHGERGHTLRNSRTFPGR